MKWADSVREMRRSGLGKSHAPMSGASDAELTDLARAADEAAFAELYVRHRRAALATARYLAPSGVDADDVVADAFAGVWGALRNGHGPQDDFRSYLMACVRNACRSRRTRATPLPTDIIEDAPGGRVVGERPLLEDPERYVGGRHRGAGVRHADAALAARAVGHRRRGALAGRRQSRAEALAQRHGRADDAGPPGVRVGLPGRARVHHLRPGLCRGGAAARAVRP